MNVTISADKEMTLEDLVLRHGAIELQNPLSKQDFIALAEHYPDWQMEREKNGIVTVMSPVKRGSGKREFNLAGLFYLWLHRTGLGEFYSPSTGFDLPNDATKSPDVAWISPERLAAAPEEDEDAAFVQIVPDFVVEIRSQTDRLKKLQTKMTDSWMANGVRLAWLIDPFEEKAYIYRQGQLTPEVVEGFSDKKLGGEEVLPGFELPLETMLRKK